MNNEKLLFVYFVGGSKGGVGKSIFCMLLADYLTKCKGRKIILVEKSFSLKVIQAILMSAKPLFTMMRLKSFLYRSTVLTVG